MRLAARDIPILILVGFLCVTSTWTVLIDVEAVHLTASGSRSKWSFSLC